MFSAGARVTRSVLLSDQNGMFFCVFVPQGLEHDHHGPPALQSVRSNQPLDSDRHESHLNFASDDHQHVGEFSDALCFLFLVADHRHGCLFIPCCDAFKDRICPSKDSSSLSIAWVQSSRCFALLCFAVLLLLSPLLLALVPLLRLLLSMTSRGFAYG